MPDGVSWPAVAIQALVILPATIAACGALWKIVKTHEVAVDARDVSVETKDIAVAARDVSVETKDIAETTQKLVNGMTQARVDAAAETGLAQGALTEAHAQQDREDARRGSADDRRQP